MPTDTDLFILPSCWIDGKEFHQPTLTIHHDVQTMDLWSNNRPDPKWSKTDKAGHFHAFDKDGNTPTLQSVVTGHCGTSNCNCGGEYEYTELECFICKERITPRWVDHGPTSTSRSDEITYRLEVKGDLPIDSSKPFSVRLKIETWEMFGFMYQSNVTRHSEYAQTTELVGQLHNRLSNKQGDK